MGAHEVTISLELLELIVESGQLALACVVAIVTGTLFIARRRGKMKSRRVDGG